MTTKISQCTGDLTHSILLLFYAYSSIASQASASSYVLKDSSNFGTTVTVAGTSATSTDGSPTITVSAQANSPALSYFHEVSNCINLNIATGNPASSSTTFHTIFSDPQQLATTDATVGIAVNIAVSSGTYTLTAGDTLGLYTSKCNDSNSAYSQVKYSISSSLTISGSSSSTVDNLTPGYHYEFCYYSTVKQKYINLATVYISNLVP